jgi:hypothetical protein
MGFHWLDTRAHEVDYDKHNKDLWLGSCCFVAKTLVIRTSVVGFLIPA